MEYLLYIDTSTDTGSVAISGDDKLLAHVSTDETCNHAGAINNMISKAMADVNISFNELSGIVVCAGPGSYTGLRIGMATAKGLCYALDKPLLLDNRLALLAYRAYCQHKKTSPQYVSLLAARDKEYFISIYDNDFVCTLSPRHIMHEQLNDLIEKRENTYFITNISPDVIDELAIANTKVDHAITIDLESWVQHAFMAYKCNDIVNLSAAEPFYLKQVYTHK